jgi:hypothetical protein
MGGALLAIAVVCMGAPAIRLLVSAKRERREVELWLGLSMASAALGIPLRFVSGVEIAQSVGQGVPIREGMGAISAMGHTLTGLASIFLSLFVWRVFHPGNDRIRQLVFVSVAAIVGSLLWLLSSGGHRIEQHASVAVGNLLRAGVLPWCACESARYWMLMRRRGRLGIGDPVVANRFALWAIWAGIFSLLPLIVLATKIAAHVSGDAAQALAFALPLLRLTLLAGVSAAFACIWLSFFPTARYLDWVRTGSGSPATAA